MILTRMAPDEIEKRIEHCKIFNLIESSKLEAKAYKNSTDPKRKTRSNR